MSFRAGAGAVVLDDRGLVLACERIDVGGQWQLPQGGLARSELPVDCVYRELAEETGIRRDSVELIDEYPDWLVYEWPKSSPRRGGRLGQAHRWFLLRLVGGEPAIDLQANGTPEFSSWRWMRLPVLAEQTNEFRRPVYRKLAQHFADYLA